LKLNFIIKRTITTFQISHISSFKFPSISLFPHHTQRSGKMAPRAATPTPDRKGQEIRFIGGVHKGKTGWLNDSRKSKDLSWVYVHIRTEQADGTVTESGSRVQVWSIAALQGEPANDLECFFQDNPNMDTALTELCKYMAKTGLSTKKIKGTTFMNDFKKLFLERLDWAADAHSRSQKKGYRGCK
jgi:hypothetical protein